MSTMNPNTNLLQAAKGTPSDKTPSELARNSSRVTFAVLNVPPPAELYVDDDDALVVQAASSQTAEAVTVNVRLLLPDGRLEDNQFIVRPANTRAVTRVVFPLSQGFMLSASAVAAVAFTRGQTFARIYLQRGASGSGQPGQSLFADYVTTQVAAAYPNGRLLSPTEGPGYVYTIASSVPGAGNDWSLGVPVNARWRIRAIQATLVTSAAVANRQVSIQVINAAGVSMKGGALTAQAASLTVSYTGMGIAPFVAANPGLQVIPLPPDLIINGQSGIVHVIQSATLNLQGGDQWSAGIALVEEWLDSV
jgi:hypothetical protein